MIYLINYMYILQLVFLAATWSPKQKSTQKYLKYVQWNHDVGPMNWENMLTKNEVLLYQGAFLYILLGQRIYYTEDFVT